MRIAVLGLWNSGSSAIAGMLHQLGVNMGPPFFGDSWEPNDLGWHLRAWWDQPRLVECVEPAHRVRFLRQWIELQECTGSRITGAKHPLLSLCAPDLVAAWGADVRFLWSYRPLDESIMALKRRRWFWRLEEGMQQRLWDALSAFQRSHGPLQKIEWRKVKANPLWGARELARAVEIDPTDAQVASAAGIVSPSARTHRNAISLPTRLYSSLRAKLSGSY